MKKFFTGLVASIILMNCMAVVAEAGQKIDVVFGQVKLVADGKPLDKETLLYNDTTYIPLRAVAEVLGKKIGYDDLTKTAHINTVETGESNIQNAAGAVMSDESVSPTYQKIDVVFGEIKLVVDGVPLDKETLLYNGTTYIPLRAAAEVLGKKVTYDAETKTAYIETEKAEEPVPDESHIKYYENFPTVPTFESVTGLPDGIGIVQPKIEIIQIDQNLEIGDRRIRMPAPSPFSSIIRITYEYDDVSDSDLKVYYAKLKSLGFKIGVEDVMYHNSVDVYEKKQEGVSIVKLDDTKFDLFVFKLSHYK